MSESSMIIHPPQKISKEQIQEWIEEETIKTNEDLHVELVDTEDWSDYVNHHHFVPLTLEGVPDGYVFDYNWIETENPRRGLPSAEVTETGKFSFWWERCNYYDLSEQQCRDSIAAIVRHETMHFEQWQRIAVSALTFLGYDVKPTEMPQTIKDLEKYNGAKEAFMRVWANGSHYQCREVEVYVTQLNNGDINPEKLSEAHFQGALQTLQTYIDGGGHSTGCAHSQWVPEFSTHLKQAYGLLNKHLKSDDTP